MGKLRIEGPFLWRHTEHEILHHELYSTENGKAVTLLNRGTISGQGMA